MNLLIITQNSYLLIFRMLEVSALSKLKKSPSIHSYHYLEHSTIFMVNMTFISTISDWLNTAVSSSNNFKSIKAWLTIKWK